MIWQDIVIATAQVLFGYSLIYQVYQGFKHKKGFLSFQTSLLTTIGLAAMTVAYLTLHLYLSSVLSGFIGILWLLLMIQAILYKSY
ncbi:hypothetical protein HYU19_00555 [Candidatus Woesearchaeota archaeon]|nr:hypothetical protein [Candidatus Woesearchaeota archaeon]